MDPAAFPGPPPVLADLYFSKIWLARQFTAPGCEPVCCDGNSPMPFARGAFQYAMEHALYGPLVARQIEPQLVVDGRDGRHVRHGADSSAGAPGDEREADNQPDRNRQDHDRSRAWDEPTWTRRRGDGRCATRWFWLGSLRGHGVRDHDSLLWRLP